MSGIIAMILKGDNHSILITLPTIYLNLNLSFQISSATSAASKNN